MKNTAILGSLVVALLLFAGCTTQSNSNQTGGSTNPLSFDRPVAAIKTLWSDDTGSKIRGYITLADPSGTILASDGKLLLVVATDDDPARQLYQKEFVVNKNEFTEQTVGISNFTRKVVMYQFEIDLKDTEFRSEECDDKCYVTLTATFTTPDGKKFSNVDDFISIQSSYIKVENISKCLIVNSRSELVEKDLYGTGSITKYYEIKGNVTNNCSSIKDMVEVVYTLYNKENTVIKEDSEYLRPYELPVGYTNGFEIDMRYEGAYKDIIELPDHYTIIAK